jgi:cold-inducible RNA-binding protein
MLMNNRLFVGNLAFHVTEDGLRRTFADFGSVAEVTLVLDRETGRSRGFAFVSMSTDDEANNAIQSLNGSDMDGRSLKVNFAEERKPRSGGFGGGGGDRGKPRRGGGDRW